MTDTPLEKAARAVAGASENHLSWDNAPLYVRDEYIAVARAVLMAVREPDRDTGDAAAIVPDMETWRATNDARFTAMIDHILRGETK